MYNVFMDTKDSWIDDFFFGFAKIVIFIPLCIFLFGLYIKYSQKSSTKEMIVIPQISPTVIKKQSLDLEGPLVCKSSSKDASVSAFIKNKQVYGEKTDKIKTQYYLLSGDCLYIWLKGGLVGKKTCGLNKYVSIVSIVFSFQVIDSLDSLIPSEIASYSGDIKSLIKTCKKEQIKNEEVFKIPKNIVF